MSNKNKFCSRIVRLDGSMIDYVRQVQLIINANRNNNVSMVEASRELALFLRNEGIHNIIERRMKYNKGRF